MLDSVLRGGRTLDSAAGRVRAMPSPDKALAIAIAGEVLRRIPDLDSLIDSATRQRLPDDSKARMVLRLALAQRIGLNTPDHAVVATALPLVDGGPRRLVHGVLGTLLRRGFAQEAPPRLPEAVEQRWARAWGENVVLAARDQIARRPALDLTFARSEDAAAYALANDGQSLASNHVRLTDGGAIPNLAGFAGGDWWVQDLASSVPARMIAGDPGDVLDLCSAPGGKAMQLASAGHRVTALDSSRQRLDRLAENFERTQLRAELVCADALRWTAGRDYDAVLLDAPCSATGTFRRHPEVLYRARPAVIRDSVGLQAALIRRAADWVRPGGTLIYAVCSLEPEEGEQQVAGFLKDRTDFAAESSPLPDFLEYSAPGVVRMLPGLLAEEGGLDGFFAARLVRKPA